VAAASAALSASFWARAGSGRMKAKNNMIFWIFDWNIAIFLS
jgi:hypothetical protein